ncbi:MAG: hypothetical protein JNN30_16125 [Rhodanobacteraceae bacterium]|nr:hypothetical protein [Rhodanobacteraceae bacterium]
MPNHSGNYQVAAGQLEQALAAVELADTAAKRVDQKMASVELRVTDYVLSDGCSRDQRADDIQQQCEQNMLDFVPFALYWIR